jgi:glutathione S-transferase
MRVIWLCEELDIPYEVVTVDFSPEYRNTAEWRAKSPTGKVPAMSDGDLTMFESGAMVHYLLEKYGNGRLRPELGSPESAIFLQWSWFAEATLARPLGDMVHHRVLKPEAERLPAMVVDGEKRARTCLEALDSALKDQEYLQSDFSAADIMIGYSLMLALRMEVLDDEYPEVQRYFKALSGRPAYEIAMK